MLETTVKKELVAKIRAKYHKLTGDDLPPEFTDDEVIYAMLLWWFEDIIA